MKRIQSKKPNVYQIRIKTGHPDDTVFFVSSLLKTESILINWCERNITEEAYEIIMKRNYSEDIIPNRGYMVDQGYIDLLESSTSIPIDVFRLDIQ